MPPPHHVNLSSSLRSAPSETDAFDRAGGVALALSSWARVVAKSNGAATVPPDDVARILDTLAKLDAVASGLSPAAAAELVMDPTLAIPANLLSLASSRGLSGEACEMALQVFKNSLACIADTPQRDVVLRPSLKALLSMIAAESNVSTPSSSNAAALLMADSNRSMATTGANASKLQQPAPLSSIRGSANRSPSTTPSAATADGAVATGVGAGHHLNTDAIVELGAYLGSNPLHVTASECALAVACVAHSTSSLVTHEHCELLIRCLAGPRTHTLALYYALAILHRFASAEPRRAHCTVLSAAGVHTALIALLQNAPVGGWHATPRGIALHVLALITEHRPNLMRPLVTPLFIANTVVPQLRSEWSEVLEGGFLWTASLAHACAAVTTGGVNSNGNNSMVVAAAGSATPGLLCSSLVAQHSLVAIAAAAATASSMRVAAAATLCLRAVMERSPVELNLPSILYAEAGPLKQLLNVVLDRVTIADSVGQRVAQTNAALTIALGLTRSAAHRAEFCRTLVHGVAYELAGCLDALRAAVDATHVSMLSSVRCLHDSAGRNMIELARQRLRPYFNPQPGARDISRVVTRLLHPPHRSSSSGTHRHDDDEDGEVSASGASEDPTAAAEQEAYLPVGLLAKCFLRAAVDLTSAEAAAGTDHSPTIHHRQQGNITIAPNSIVHRTHAAAEGKVATATASTAGLRLAAVSQGNVYHKAFELATKLAKCFVGNVVATSSASTAGAAAVGTKSSLLSSATGLSSAAAAAGHTAMRRSHSMGQSGKGTRSAPIAKLDNVWRSPDKLVERRTWTAAEVERRDLLVLYMPWSADHRANAACVQRTLVDAKEHLVQLNVSLQTCPVSQYRRRAMLNDLYVNVVPRVVGCLEFLADCAEDSELSAKVLDLLRHRAQSVADPGTAMHAAGLELAEVAVDSSNLGEVCSALASL